MHYYMRNIGDYTKDTPHLTALEHGVYNLLLDYYYATEKPLPPALCERIARASTDAECAAVKSVLKDFFKMTRKGWRHSRADAVIQESTSKSLKAKASAEIRWQCERNANAMRWQCERYAIH